MAKYAHFSPLEYIWDGKIRSARELFRLLHDFLNKYNYEHSYHALIDTPGAIAGTATFSDNLIGRKDYKKLNKGLFISGIVLFIIGAIVAVIGVSNDTFGLVAVGAVLVVAGIILIAMSSTTLRKCIRLDIEGETYLAKGKQTGKTSSEVLDVASNCRVVFSGEVGIPEKDKTTVHRLTTNENEWESLKSEFESLKTDFKELRPKIEVPEAIPPAHKD